MRFVIEMPEVRRCDASHCAYNIEGGCHAKAITVGNGVHPGCDTYMPSRRHPYAVGMAGVGACKVEACRHNHNLECTASTIEVRRRDEGGADCGTYERRKK